MAKRWYVVHVYSGFEKKIAQQVKEQAAQKGLSDLVDDVLVPAEDVVEMRRGQKVNAERKFFPGYVLVKCDLTDEVYHLIKNTPKVTGFLGADKAKPVPIVLFGSDYWKRLIDFDFLAEEGVISPEDVKLFEYVDAPADAWDAIKRFYKL